MQSVRNEFHHITPKTCFSRPATSPTEPFAAATAAAAAAAAATAGGGGGGGGGDDAGDAESEPLKGRRGFEEQGERTGCGVRNEGEETVWTVGEEI